MKKIKLLFCFAFLAFAASQSFAQNWVWARQGNLINSGDGSEGWSVTADVSGNAYLAGYYSGDTLIFGTDTLTYFFGLWEPFLVKYSNTGNVLWAKDEISKTNTTSFLGYGVATDMRDNVYLTGSYTGSVSIGSYSLSSNNTSECYLAKYNPAGNVLWAKQSIGHPSNSQTYGEGICTDKNANIYITGNFEDTTSFGSFQLNEPIDCVTAFITKYDSNGNTLWAKQAVNHSTYNYSTGLGVVSDKRGNAYITGYFTDTAYFGTYKLTTPLQHNHLACLLLVKYNSAGNILWAKQAAASDNTSSIGYAVTTDKLNNIYVTGSFQDTLKIGSQKLFSNTSDLFVAKFDSNGNNIWIQSATILDSSYWSGYAISIDTNENIYVSAGGVSGGAHEYRIVLEKDTFKTYIATDDGASLVMKMDTSGKFLCASIVAGGGDDNNGIAVDPPGKNVYFGGDLWTNAIIGQDTLSDPPYHEFPFITKWQADCENSTSGINPVTTVISPVLVYPNPSNGQFTLSLSHSELVSGAQTILIIYNMLGESIYTRYAQAGDNMINLSNQPNGVYLYRVTNEEGNLIGEGKLIVQH